MKKILVIAGVAALAATGASAAGLTAPTIDTSDFMTIAASVLAATGVFFGIRKALGLLY